MRSFARRYALPLVALSGLVLIGVVDHRSIDELNAAPAPQSRRPPGSAGFRGLAAEDLVHSFYFARAIYGGGGGYRRSSWSTDWPYADRWITNVLRRLTAVDVFPREHSVALDDPELRRFPFLYTLEVGYMSLRESEVEGLRNYLLAGGFLMVDDFHGTREWRNWEREIRRVLPEYEMVELPIDHEVFSSFYEIDEIVQVPVVSSGIWGGPTWESDVPDPYCLGIFDDDGRLMVVINWNTDIGDAWEHAEDPRYPLRYSTFAYQIAANLIIHAMTH